MPVVALSLTYDLPWREMRGIVIAVFFSYGLSAYLASLPFAIRLLPWRGSGKEWVIQCQKKKKPPVDH
jgi:hypothetical protein